MNNRQSPQKRQGSSFGQLMAEKRTRAGISLQEIATLTGLSLNYLENLEREGREVPTFDMCYKIGQAINSRELQGFLVQDLWEAASFDRKTMRFRTIPGGNQQPAIAPA